MKREGINPKIVTCTVVEATSLGAVSVDLEWHGVGEPCESVSNLRLGANHARALAMKLINAADEADEVEEATNEA